MCNSLNGPISKSAERMGEKEIDSQNAEVTPKILELKRCMSRSTGISTRKGSQERLSMPIKVKRDLDAVLAKNKTNRKIITQTNKVIKLARGLFKDADINLRKLKKQRTVYIQPQR